MNSLVCAECGVTFEARREAVYCSDACRSRAYKARREEQAQNGIERIPTQAERVLKASKSFRGITQVDFLLPNVIDGGPPITRLAARINELDAAGHSFECLGRREKCKIWRLVESDVDRGSGPSPDSPAAAPVDAGSLFEVPVGKPEVPHWQADVEAA